MMRRRWPIAVAIVVAIGLAVAFSVREPLYNQLVLAVVAHEARGDASETEEEVALNLLNHVVNLAPQPLGPEVHIDDNAAGTLVRGGGWCDSLAMALVQVAELAGYRGQVVFLFDDDGVSPHTLSTLYVDGEYRVFDPFFQSVTRTAEGHLATISDIAAGSAPTPHEDLRPEHFANSQVFYETPTGGMKTYVRSVARAAMRSVARTLAAPTQDLYLAVTRPSAAVTVNGEVWEDWNDPGERELWEGRHRHVFGRMNDAADAYRSAAARGSDQAEAWLQRLDQPQLEVTEIE